MRLEDAFSRILDVESRDIARDLSWYAIKVWPLVRQCLWFELTQVKGKAENTRAVVKATSFKQRVFDGVSAATSAFLSSPQASGDEATAFISRPLYLQALPNGVLFDRIVDPLAFCMPSNIIHSKYYVAKWPKRSRLYYSAALLRPGFQLSLKVSKEHRAALFHVACAAGIDPQQLLLRYAQSLRAFGGWYSEGQKFFEGRRHLKTLYVASWYFPDMMGLIAAAKEWGVKTLDLQHGKQGKFQAMYSGWRIPDEGYQMMPDVFWCWGMPSAKHILESSPNRKFHRPLVGGHPWLDYYRRHISSKTAYGRRSTKKYVLVTIQPPQADNIEPIPDFLLDFLSDRPKNVYFIFRCHPNDKNGLEYCRGRLPEFASDLYEIDIGYSNLYDQMLTATHHITAFSSCCYEAEAFGIPTLLFGADAYALYKDEIESGSFSWTAGSARDLTLWLETRAPESDKIGNPYIISALEHTRTIVQQVESGHLDLFK